MRLTHSLAHRCSLVFVLTALLAVPILSSACAKAPVTASPAAKTAFYQDRVYKALGAIRDTAVAANDAAPPLITRDVMRKIVQWEDSAIVTIHAGPGWKPVVTTGLDELMKSLADAERNLLSPYVALAKTLLQEIE